MTSANSAVARTTYWEDLARAAESIPHLADLRGVRILVTGATGMLCSSIVDILLYLNRVHGAGNTVFVAGRDEQSAANRFGSFGESEGLRFVHYDATSSSAVALDSEVDFVIHGASNANPALYATKPVETMLANIVGLSTMFELAIAHSAKRLVYVSSSEIYGTKPDTTAFSEDDYGYLDILNERAGYPSSKRAGESLCIAYGMERDIDSVIVRPGHIYGPAIRDSDNRASAEFTRKALAGQDVVMKSRGTQLRSYCHALDCASAILTVMLRGEPANAYNISNPHSICSISDMAGAFARAGGVNLEFSESTIGHNLMENSSLASDKLEALGWKPAFDLDYGVERTLATLREVPGPFSL